MKYDILILSKDEDLNKVPFLIESIKNNLIGYNKIYLISETKILSDSFINFTDDEVIDISLKSQLKYRPNWIYQQYIKLFQKVTELDLYLVLDSDIYINSKIDLFKDNKPYFFIGQDQYHKPYFNYLERFSIYKNYNKSFISEMMFFSKRVVENFIQSRGFPSSESFIEFSNSIIDNNCYISEFELYGNYVLQHLPESYDFKQINTFNVGKHGIWTDEEIRNIINKNNNLDIISYHTWK